MSASFERAVSGAIVRPRAAARRSPVHSARRGQANRRWAARRPRRAVDLPAPGAGLLAPALDHLLEALEVRAHPATGQADRVRGALRQALRLGVHHDHDLGAVVGQPVEVHGARVPRPLGARPGDPGVGDLLGDPGVELLGASRRADDPVQPLVVELLDPVDRLHERRELLELRPLVVGGGHRHPDLDRLLDL
jgi:hypothetical protein